jgi:SSS family transporter
MDAIQIKTGDMIILGLYLLANVIVGLGVSRKKKTTEEYLLGGRKIPWFAVGISYMMSLVSTVSLVAVPGEIFNHGLSLLFLGLLYPVFSILGFYIFLRFYFRLGSFTPFEYLERRFDGNVRVMISGIYLWTRLLYLAMVLFSASKVFEGAAGWNPVWTILLMGVIGIFYTVIGGMKAVIWTEVLQFAFLIGGIAVAIGICIQSDPNGIPGIWNYAMEHGRGLTLFAQKDFYLFDPYIRLSFWLLLIGKIMEPIFYNCADQISIQRLLSTSSYENAKKAIYTNSFLSLPFMLLLWFIGLAIYTYYGRNPDPRVTSGDLAFFVFVSTKMPSPFSGLMLAAMLAAAMSTLNSGMNSLSAVWLKEFHQKYINKNMSETRQVGLSRWVTLGVGIFSIAGAIGMTVSTSSLQESVIESLTLWSVLSTIVVPVFLLAVTSERINSKFVWWNCAICLGINFGMATWYILSKKGLIGPISLNWLVWPAVLSFLLILISRMVSFRKKTKIASAVHWIGLCVIGYGIGLLFWYLMSHRGGGTLSFLWVGFPGFVSFMVCGYIGSLFLPKQEKWKTYGLTLRTMNGTPLSEPHQQPSEEDSKLDQISFKTVSVVSLNVKETL